MPARLSSPNSLTRATTWSMSSSLTSIVAEDDFAARVAGFRQPAEVEHDFEEVAVVRLLSKRRAYQRR